MNTGLVTRARLPALFQRQKLDTRLKQPPSGSSCWGSTLHISTCSVSKTVARRLAYSILGKYRVFWIWCFQAHAFIPHSLCSAVKQTKTLTYWTVCPHAAWTGSVFIFLVAKMSPSRPDTGSVVEPSYALVPKKAQPGVETSVPQRLSAGLSQLPGVAAPLARPLTNKSHPPEKVRSLPGLHTALVISHLLPLSQPEAQGGQLPCLNSPS